MSEPEHTCVVSYRQVVGATYRRREYQDFTPCWDLDCTFQGKSFLQETVINQFWFVLLSDSADSAVSWDNELCRVVLSRDCYVSVYGGKVELREMAGLDISGYELTLYISDGVHDTDAVDVYYQQGWLSGTPFPTQINIPDIEKLLVPEGKNLYMYLRLFPDNHESRIIFEGHFGCSLDD